MDFLFLIGFILLFCAIYYIFELLFNLFVYLITNIPYYLMGKNAGFDQSWVAFLPTGRDYISFTIPHYEYNLGFFKTRNRKLVYWIWFGFEALTYIVTIISAVILFFASSYFADYYSSSVDSETINDSIVIISRIISFGFSAILFVIRSIIHWRKNYDLLITYNLEGHAMWASIVNAFCPLVMFVFSFILVGRSPDYGMGGYYFNENEEYNEYDEQYEY